MLSEDVRYDKKFKGNNSNVISIVKCIYTTLAIWNPVIASTPLYNSSNLDELLVQDIDD